MEIEDQSEASGVSNKGTQYRVLITNEANDAIDTLVKRVNEGWEAGRVTKPQVVSWILIRMAKKFSEKELHEVRAVHFNKIAYLESLLKKAKDTGEVPEELALLAPESPSNGKRQRSSKPDSN